MTMQCFISLSISRNFSLNSYMKITDFVLLFNVSLLEKIPTVNLLSLCAFTKILTEILRVAYRRFFCDVRYVTIQKRYQVHMQNLIYLADCSEAHASILTSYSTTIVCI